MIVPVFAATLFVSSFLMFAVEPMAARQLLPVLGGTPMVWNGCVVFFQAVLLLGYGAAHLIGRWIPARTRLLAYAVLALASWPVVNLRIDMQTGAWAERGPLTWLLTVLVSTVGLPFLILAVSSSTVQSAFASSSHKSARDPYFLYVASNAGSLVALIAYPSLIEPWLGLAQQANLWTAGYAMFLGLTMICAILGRWALPQSKDHRSGGLIDDAGTESAGRVSLSDRVRWCALAAVPSSLMLGVTTSLTTDIAPVPLLWVVPLSLYLLTFIVAFGGYGSQATAFASRWLPLVLVVLASVLVLHLNLPIVIGLLVHLIPFIVAALACHGRLAAARPAPRHLTEFYFWLALGGMAGGLFNTLVAPTLFSTVLEYPLALALVAFLGPASPAGRPRLVDAWMSVVVILVFVALRSIRMASSAPYVVGGTAFVVTLIYTQRQRRWAFAGALGVLILIGPWITRNAGTTLRRERTFFGTYAVRADGEKHVLSHGTTMHGMQATATTRLEEPLTYYHRRGPFGQMMANIPQLRAPGQFAAIGLGVGTLAAYRRTGQQWTFYEIDSAIEQIARDERLFTYLPHCGNACRVVLGDARLSLGVNKDARYQLIALDAFTSDAIPVHLLTNEAMHVYLSRLAPNGVLAIHISNRHLRLAPIIARLASANGLVAIRREDAGPETLWPEGRFSSEWMMMARSSSDLGALPGLREWNVVPVLPSTPLWTDDFTHLLGILDLS